MAARLPIPSRRRRSTGHAEETSDGGVDPLLERIAWVMDNAIRIPGTNRRIGIDPLLGLFPGVGDFVGTGIQIALILLAVQRYKVPRAVVARMAANTLLDMGVGAVPLAGDLFDAGFKANSRNVRLLRDVTAERRRGRPDEELNASSKRYLIALGAGLGIGMLALLVGSIALIVWLVQRFSA